MRSAKPLPKKNQALAFAQLQLQDSGDRSRPTYIGWLLELRRLLFSDRRDRRIDLWPSVLGFFSLQQSVG